MQLPSQRFRMLACASPLLRCSRAALAASPVANRTRSSLFPLPRNVHGGALLIATLALLAIPSTALADKAQDAAKAEMTQGLGQVPPHIAVLPEGAQAGAWGLAKGMMGNPNGKIPPKYRELIALGVAAQIPCTYCVYAHTKFAKANGATDEEVREAVGYAGEVRLWSTVLNGNQYDLGEFKSSMDSIGKFASERSAKPK